MDFVLKAGSKTCWGQQGIGGQFAELCEYCVRVPSETI